MNSDNQHNRPLANDPVTRQSHTARFNLPVRAPGVWQFLLEQLLGPAVRLRKFRNLSTRMIEDTLDQVDGRPCQ